MTSVKEFTWQNEDDGKKQFHEFYALLEERLGVKSCEFVLSPLAIQRNTPISPGPQPANAVDLREWRKAETKYRSEMKEFRGNFDTAKGILRSMLKWPSKARNDFDMAIKVIPAGVDPIEWTEDRQFQAALNRIIQGYSPSNITDTTTIRKNMQDLSDSIDGGFYRYQQEFTRLHAELIKAGQAPEDRDLIEWIKKGISNIDVKKFMAQFFYTGAPQISSDDLFSRIREYLQFLMLSSDPIDPYKTISSGHNTITAKLSQIELGDVNPPDGRDYYRGRTPRKTEEGTSPRGNKTERRCTRCWHKGHRWTDCHSTKCAVCGHLLNSTMTYCPDYRNHTEPGTNWRYKKPVANGGTPGDTTDPQAKTLKARKEAMKEACKAYKTALRASKKQKT